MKLRTDLDKVLSSRTGTAVVVATGITLTGLLVFHAGVAYGERQVYHRMHQNSSHPPFGFFSHSFIPETHGAVGTITEIALPMLMVKTRDGGIETIIVSSTTLLRGTSGAPSDLEVGQNITVLGEPDGADIKSMQARFITVSPVVTH